MITSSVVYSAREVADAAGVSYRQLDYWCRLGLVRPSIAEARGSGSRRAFTSHDLAIVRVLGAVGGRVPLNKLEGLVGYLTDLPLQQWAATRLVLGLDGDVWLAQDAAPKVGIHVDLSLIYDPPA